MDGSVAQQSLEAYTRASRSLAELYRERGDVIAASIEAKTQGYQQAVSDGGTVSDARHAADLASQHLVMAIAKLDGEISGLEVELRYLDQLLAHAKWMNGTR